MDYQLLFARFKTAQASAGGARQSQQQQLYMCLRNAILARQFSAGMRISSSRALAAELKLSRNTVLYAYEQLITEGLLQTQGRATIVALNAPAMTAAQPPARKQAPRQLAARAQLNAWPTEPHGEFTAFMPGVPALSAFPIQSWRRCLERAWRGITYRQLDYSDASGEPVLRAAIADHLTGTRGVLCVPQQVFITDGTQQSLNLCAHAFAAAGDCVWIENPGYGGAFQALQAAELSVRGIAVDQQGIAPTAADWQIFPPKLIYTTPSHQFPLGSVMSIERRISLLELAKKHSALIIEDDYDSEFRRDGPPLPAMQGLVEDAPVIYLGTFSKTLFPALRIGFMVVPEVLAESFAQLLQLSCLRGRSADQLALAEFLRSGQFAIHLRKMRRLYAARRDALVAALEKYLGHIVTIHGGSSGIHLAIELPDSLSDQAISEAALSQGIYTQPLSKLATGPRLYNGLLLGYAQVDAQAMENRVKCLADVMRI